MAKIQLTGGAYQARSLIAGAQSCINLIPERVPQTEGESAPAAHYPTPGLALLAAIGTGGWRCAYRATNGILYGVVGSVLYAISSTYVATVVGGLSTSTGPVSMSDNTVDLLAVDGTAAGYHVILATNAFNLISDPAFYGGDRIDCLDGFFVLNRPGTNQFYLSDNIAVTWNPLYIAAKAGLDILVTFAVTMRQLWLVGEKTTETWSDAGASDFPFQIAQGGIEQGCIASASLVRTEGLLFWLSRTRDGQAVVIKGWNYLTQRVSNHAIEAAIGGYAVISDAVGWSYQLGGHTVIVMTFPSANATWCYDLASEEWHEWQSNGGRHLGEVHCACYGLNLVGDYSSGNLYALSFDTYTDNGAPITRTRAFPHLVGNANRVIYSRFIADMQCGTVAAGLPAPVLTLSWSDDRGATWSTPVTVGMGLAGAANTSLQFRRLGMARDRVFKLSWSAAVPTALMGAWIETKVLGS